MTGYFIISMDCESKWGSADILQPYHHEMFTNEALISIYRKIVKLLKKYDMCATFAFVMAMILNEQERQRFAPLFNLQSESSRDWLSHFRVFESSGELNGWFEPELLNIVRQYPQHEIACHSFCHSPMTDDVLSSEQACIELDAALKIAKSKNIKLRTFIFPRNGVGNRESLFKKGFIGYRNNRYRKKGLIGRAFSLLDEFDIFPKPESIKHPVPGEPVCIPAGLFFNSRFGGRRYVPPTVTIQRWKNFLNNTANSGGVAHLWFHPHNLISAPKSLGTLEQVFAHAADLAANRRLEIITQENYCQKLLFPNP